MAPSLFKAALGRRLDLSNLTDAERQRPEVRLKVAITGNRETDLHQYRKTLLQWSSRKDVFDDGLAHLSHGYAKTYAIKPKFVKSAPPVTDPVESERLHGVFLGQVSSMWQYLAIAAADRGELDEAVRLLRRDLEGRPASRWSGGMLAEYLLCQGKFDEAWQAYRNHFLRDPPFDAFELRQSWTGVSNVSHAASDIVEGIDLSIEFKKFPEILQRIDEWNARINVVDSRRLQDLGSPADTLSSDWFRNLDEFSKLRVLYYYYSTRPHEKDLAYFDRTGGKVRELQESVNEREEFEAALHTSKEAEAIWARATSNRRFDYPL